MAPRDIAHGIPPCTNSAAEEQNDLLTARQTEDERFTQAYTVVQHDPKIGDQQVRLRASIVLLIEDIPHKHYLHSIVFT